MKPALQNYFFVVHRERLLQYQNEEFRLSDNEKATTWYKLVHIDQWTRNIYRV